MNNWREMKHWILLLLVLSLDLCLTSCPDNMFLLPGSICCDFCPDGRYVAVNCTKQNEAEYKGVTCEKCSVCGEGWQMVSPCTNFSDTVCEENVTPIPIASMEMVLSSTTLYIIIPSSFFMIVGALVYRWYMRRKVTHDPADEPFKIRV